VTALVKQLGAARTPGYVRALDFSPWRGAYNRMPADATAFAHREESFLVEHSADITHSTSPVLSDATDWIDGSWQTTHPWGAGGVYPNFPDPGLQNWETAYHGANLTKLRQVKHHYDPGNWFRFHQSLTPAIPHTEVATTPQEVTKPEPTEEAR
jgi:hypothetical protein